jgi:tetratricopeptide (TPR) repeat protein/tRNA A-37 threonylcarbamoyl transferase component Bud32
MSSAPVPEPLTDCPSSDDLFAFSVGKVPVALREQISTHLDHCARCLTLLGGLDEGRDPLLAELRQPLPSGVLSGPAAAPPSSASTGPARNQPTSWPGGAVPARLSPSAASRYHARRFHARGGLGEVHVAHDQELDREVALKRIRPERAEDSDSRRRFFLEAEITGKLEHPGVVPVYGLVRGAGGQPCYAMRFVQGESLKDAIERFHAAEGPGRDPGERSLTLRQLLGRFVAVCNTVAYAHSRGIIHRDIKPANILLGRYGETLVVDWGLAKPFARTDAERSGGEETLAPTSGSTEGGTQLGQAVGTPAYMSPEQADGLWDRVGPASDISSLGATLYHLLTGQAPFQGNSQHEVLVKARRGEFPPPRAVQRRVPAALEAICLKAMALQPEERYATALELAADVEHWLADEPVTAYREPWLGRAWRWVRRHRTPVASALAATLAVLLLGGAGALWLQQQAAERQAEAARREAALRQGILAALDKAADLQKRARWGEARAVLDQAAERLGDAGPIDLRRRVEQARDDLRLVGRLDAVRLQAATFREGKFDWAAAERGYAAAFHGAGLGPEGGAAGTVASRIRGSAIREQLIAALDDWAGLAKGRRRAWLLAVARRADPDPWRDRFRDPKVWQDRAALEQLARAAKVEQLSPYLLTNLGIALLVKEADAVPLLQAAQRHYPQDFWLTFHLGNALLKAKKPEPAIGYYRGALALRPEAAVYNNLGNALSDTDRLEEATANYRQALALDPRFVHAHNNLGNALRKQGRLEEAIACFQKALALEPRHALAHNNLGAALQDKGRLDRAITCYRKALTLDPGWAGAHCNLGIALQKKGRLDQAIACYRKALALDPGHARAHTNLGVALQDQGRLDEAIACHRQAIRFDPKLALAHYALGTAWQKKGQVDQAIACFQQALALDPRFARAHNNLGNALEKKGRREEAIACYQKAIALDPKNAKAHSNLGVALSAQGRLDEAIACYQEAITLNPNYAQAHTNLGAALFLKGELDQAVAAFRAAIHIKQDLAPAHWALGIALRRKGDLDGAIAAFHQAVRFKKDDAEAHHDLGLALQARGRVEEAIACYQKAIALDPRLAGAHWNLGRALSGKGRLEEAIAEYQEAIRLKKDYAQAHASLGTALEKKGDLDGAIAAYREAVRLQKGFVQVHTSLGFTLLRKGDPDEARAAFQEAIRLKKDFARGHLGLGLASVRRGQFAEALAAFRRAQALDSRNPEVRQAIRYCERQVELDKRLPAVLQGKDRPGAAERAEFGRLCGAKGLYATAARFYRDAFAAQPRLAQDLKAGHLYPAACAAARAGCGQGADTAAIDEQERRHWRRQALKWLAAALALVSKNPDAAGRQRLAHWQRDPNLAGLRDESGLAWLPQEEQVACRRFWADVNTLLERAGQR